MIALLYFIFAVLAAPFKSKSRLEAENAVLRHQLIVLRRKVRGRVRLSNNDRWLLIRLYRWFPSILQVVTIVQPKTSGNVVMMNLLGGGLVNFFGPILGATIFISSRDLLSAYISRASYALSMISHLAALEAQSAAHRDQ